MTLLKYKQPGKGLEITYGFHPTIFGECLIGVSSRGICFLNFLDGTSRRQVLEHQKANWKNAGFKSDSVITGKIVKRIFTGGGKPAILLVKGTDFQIKVWEALLKIDFGATSSYKKIAAAIGKFGAVRAVGNACGRNDWAFLIPCHRVLTSGGELGGYRWGEKRKLAILEWERAKASQRLLYRPPWQLKMI